MNTKKHLIIPIVIFIFFNSLIYSQHKKESLESMYVTITTLHGSDKVDVDEWLKVEKEYFEKVTSKIDLIIEHEVLVRYFPGSLSEIKVINVIKNWNDIQEVNYLREKMIEKAWPNEAERAAFFEKQNSFYTNFHSDEIYVSTSLSKKMSASEKASLKNPMVYYIDTNILSDIDNKDAHKLYEEYLNTVTYKNDYIKAYYPLRHYWGADSREFLEFYVVSSLSNLERALDMDKQLFTKHMPDATKRKEFLNTYRRTVSSHKDALFKNVPALSK